MSDPTTDEKQFVFPEAKAAFEHHVRTTKKLRQDLDGVLQNLRESMGQRLHPDGQIPTRSNRERSIVVTKIQEAIMWLGMDLKAINEENPGSSPNPYPQSYNPESTVIEPTADGLKL